MQTLPSIRVPDFLYGTAWKEDRTADLVELALRMGFRGIDTANQRRHYAEIRVGEALAAAYRAGTVSIAQMFSCRRSSRTRPVKIIGCLTIPRPIFLRKLRSRWPVRWNTCSAITSTATFSMVPHRRMAGAVPMPRRGSR